MIRLWLTIFAVICCVSNVQADVEFRCPSQLATLQQEVPAYLHLLKIPAEQVIQTVDTKSGVITLALATAQEDTSTLDLSKRSEYSITVEQIRLPMGRGKTRAVLTVSKKEILLALLQHGRLTEFEGKTCALESLIDHVGVRQNIVAWAENLDWNWPNGGSAKWNSKYWKRGTPKPDATLQGAIMDAFIHQHKYAIGCYTATKMVVVQGVLDYYRRVKSDPVATNYVEAALLVDGDPLVDVEPSDMWTFENDFDPREMQRPGKLLTLHANVPLNNFIPGDWGYLLNTDVTSNQKTGYEGSNALYLGRNRFDDYYNDNKHGYTYEQKLDEVYQWRNGVFSRSRDARKIKPLASEELAQLGNTPAKGGIQLDVRLEPRHF